ncbi:biorientation of chromosomes in cell division protein 1-like 1 [Zerene cesonia]|uniref:biorientation of chromosomes in cell division protein 1-like 1 n=1 Tax=Zerene cesonia TaxID=33412 RepID=UPI0018E53213|nr:biorientation of chromosomes in cell division protein 1-like 1 [Zerene cesonia]
MAHLQYMPGDPRLVDQLVYELKSKGIFDQFRKDCIADVDTRPAYQNLRQRVENSVSTFLARQCWQPDLNKNQLREKLRKHILDGNYLEQGVERIVDQVVNPKVATVFVPKVEDLVYNYLGITRKKTTVAETSNGNIDLLPNDLEAVSPGSVKSNDDKNETMDIDESMEATKMEVDDQTDKDKLKEENNISAENNEKEKSEETETAGANDVVLHESDGSDDKESIPLPAEEIRPEDIPPPENSPPKVELEKIELPKDPDVATDIPLPDEILKEENENFFKPINTEDDDDSSSDSSLRRNMSPLTPIRNYNNENSCDAQQGFENDFVETKEEEIKEPSSFRFAIEAKSTENSLDTIKTDKKEAELSYQFNQVNINNFNSPACEDSSNSNNLQIDYESDANSKINNETKVEPDQNSEDAKKSKKPEEKKSSHKSSHRSRDSHKHSSSKDKKSESKPTSSRDSSRHDKKSSSKDDSSKNKSTDKERSRDRSDKKDSKDSSRHRSSHKSSHKDSKSHRSSSSSHRSHSSKHSDDKKSSSSSHKEKDKSSDKSSSKEVSKEKSKDSKSSSHRSDKERKGSSSSTKNKSSDKDKEKKTKKDADDHYSLSGRGNPNRRSTDRDSNDGSSSSKGSHRPSSSKSSESKKDSKESTSKSENTSGSGSTSPSDKENVVHDAGTKASTLQNKPIIRVETHLETPVSSPPRLPFVPDITLKKPKIAANFEEAKKIMKMRKFLEDEQRRMNQEAALLLEFQANVRPSLSQVYSSIPGPELEFACDSNATRTQYIIKSNENAMEASIDKQEQPTYTNAELYDELNEGNQSNDVNNSNELVCNEDNAKRINESVKCDADNEHALETENKDFKIEATADNTYCDCVNIQENNQQFAVLDVSGKKIKGNTGNLKISEINYKLSRTEKQSGSTVKNVKSKEEDDTNTNLFYFAEHEKYESEIEKSTFSTFLKSYLQKAATNNKIYLINCDTYEENVIREASKTFGEFEIINYQRNGHLKLPKTKSIVKNVNISDEVSLPLDIEFERSNDTDSMKSQVFSPGKSDCSFELSDYDTKLEQMVHTTSRKEIMEIILGDIVDDSLTKMPKIDYITESNIDSAMDCNLKRKLEDVETTENNNRRVLTPNKIRKMSTSDLITSTTEDNEETEHNSRSNTRSKYLGRAKRVGLPRPRRPELPNSPSSDKSVENYEQNSQTAPKTPNGKVKTPRNVVQRYETSDLYKPKLHYLSRRNVS